MKAEKLYPEEKPEKIKYVLNGETRYYTRDELKEYLIELHNNSGINHPDPEGLTDKIIQRLEQHNGDPYGHIQDSPDLYETCHSCEATGKIYVIRSYYGQRT